MIQPLMWVFPVTCNAKHLNWTSLPAGPDRSGRRAQGSGKQTSSKGYGRSESPSTHLVLGKLQKTSQGWESRWIFDTIWLGRKKYWLFGVWLITNSIQVHKCFRKASHMQDTLPSDGRGAHEPGSPHGGELPVRWGRQAQTELIWYKQDWDMC